MTKYFETINYISALLTLFSIPHNLISLYDGWQLTFSWCKGDVACHSGTYGSNQYKVETYCFPWDEGDVTMMSSAEAAIRIANHYINTVGEI